MQNSFYDQSESDDLSDIQMERIHVKTNFCSDNTNFFYIFLLLFSNIALIYFFVFRSRQISTKLSTIVSRVPLFVSNQKSDFSNLYNFSLDLKLSNLFHNADTVSKLNCTAIKTKPRFYHRDRVQLSRISTLSHFEKYENLLNSTINSFFEDFSSSQSFVDFQISGKYRIFNRFSNFSDFYDLVPKKIRFEFPEDSPISQEFNILSFYFNDPRQIGEIHKNVDYAEHTVFNSPAVSFQFLIQSNSNQINGLDFQLHYSTIFVDEIFQTDLRLFGTFLLASFIYTIMSNVQVPFPTTPLCFIMTIFGLISSNCIQWFIPGQISSQKDVFPQIFENAPISFFRKLWNVVQLFSFALFINLFRLLVNAQLYFLYRQTFHRLNRRPTSTILTFMSIFYLLFSVIEFQSSFEIKQKYQTSLFLSSFTTSHSFITTLRTVFLIIHFCIFFILLKYSHETVVNEPDPLENKEYNRFISIVLFSIVSNVASIYVTWFYVNPDCILPEIFYYASFYFSASSILILLSGVAEKDDSGFERLQNRA